MTQHQENLRNALAALLLCGEKFGHRKAIRLCEENNVSFYTDTGEAGYTMSLDYRLGGGPDEGMAYALTPKAIEFLKEQK